MERKTEGVEAPTPWEREATRRYLQGEMDNVKPSEFDGKVKVKFTGDGESKHLNITAEQYEAIKKIIVPEQVTYDPCIQGTIDIEGSKSEFFIPFDRGDIGYSQWGADNTVLWPRVALLEGLATAAKEWWLDQSDGLTGFTVSGYWGDDDTRIVTSVIEGEHEVSGGDDVSEGGPFAVYVRAEDAAAAESKVQGTTEEDDLDG